MKKISLIFYILVFISIVALRSSLAQGPAVNMPGALFYQANIYYQEGRYDEAIDVYEKLLGQGLESGNLYYNLGNSYFKKGELGLAVLNYERARILIPNDSDLKSNYDYAIQRLNLEPKFTGNHFEKTVYNLFQAITVDSLTILLSVIYVVVILLLTLNLFLSGARRFTGWVICALVFLSILFVFALNRKISYINKTAVVISKEADVKFEPLENATTYFKLSEGSKVEVVEKAEGWYKVRRFDNKFGWVIKAALNKIN
ncbi:MAG: tetratricopeptide repeat protein [Candidatus Omnitrophica bacterium]|nr:tetratricopeptide repeat protein [Candidatus Omnitrophota bacterium]